MVNFTVEQIRQLMDRPECIRNISVIAHVDHGKTTLTDSLIAKAGIISHSRSGETRATDGKKMEIDRGITIESTSVSLYYERDSPIKPGTNEPYLINLIDSPGHVDFSSEVTAALRVTDGALVVVDCIEGVCVQTETVLRQAISERIRPVLFLNKLDRVFLEQHKSLEETYTTLRNSVESVNVVCQTYRDEKLGTVELNPAIGNVGFGSGLHAWGFTLVDFAKMYSSRFGLCVSKMMKKLWGEWYWDSSNRRWNKNRGKGVESLERGFCQFILKPLKVMIDSIMAGDKDIFEPVINALGLKFSKKDIEEAAKKREKGMVKLTMRTWLPAGDTLLDMVADHLPSPLVAQSYRVESLYSGPADSPEVDWIVKCDKNAPLSMYVSKMVKAGPSRFIAFGRVFSGTVKAGQEVRILGPDYEHGGKKDLHIKKIQRVLLMMANKTDQIGEVPCGNVCGLVGVDQYLEKSGTITSAESFHPFHSMKFSVASVVQVAVEAKNAADLPKLVEGLRKLRQMHSSVQTSISKTGQHIVAGAGQLHLEVCMDDLREELNGAEIVVSEPVVSYSETISMRTGEDSSASSYPSAVWAKSPNKLNRLQASAEPLDAKFVAALDKGEVTLARQSDLKAFGQKLRDEFGWESSDARRIWTFGCPPDGVANCVVDQTKGTAYLTEIRDHVRSGFMEITENGVLSEEPLRGVRFNVLDAKVHSDSAHRGAGSIIPCAKKVFYGCQLASGPRLLEPMYLVDITVPRDALADVFSTLSSVRGITESVTERVGTPLTQIKAHLPVAESFDFAQLLRKNTGGKAFPQMSFSHWQVVDSDPLTRGTSAHRTMLAIRERKGLKLEIPSFVDFSDRIR